MQDCGRYNFMSLIPVSKEVRRRGGVHTVHLEELASLQHLQADFNRDLHVGDVFLVPVFVPILEVLDDLLEHDTATSYVSPLS